MKQSPETALDLRMELYQLAHYLYLSGAFHLWQKSVGQVPVINPTLSASSQADFLARQDQTSRTHPELIAMWPRLCAILEGTEDDPWRAGAARLDHFGRGPLRSGHRELQEAIGPRSHLAREPCARFPHTTSDSVDPGRRRGEGLTLIRRAVPARTRLRLCGRPRTVRTMSPRS